MERTNRWILLMMTAGILFFGCQQEKEDPLPYEDEKIISILLDVHLAEAALQSLGKVMKDSMTDVYYDQIYTIHHISKADFQKMMELLRNSPKNLNRIYGQLMERVEIEEKEIEARIETKRRDKDSTDLIKIHEEKTDE